MFDTKQKIDQKLFDERLLPSSGLITIKKMFSYIGVTFVNKEETDYFINECEKNNITIFKIVEDNEPPYRDARQNWLVCLDDFKRMRNIAVE